VGHCGYCVVFLVRYWQGKSLVSRVGTVGSRIKFTMKFLISIPEISIYIFINIKISIKRCKNVDFFTKNAL